MTNSMRLETLLPESSRALRPQLTLFALLNLGLIESLVNGLVSPTNAVRFFFNADNCLFVRRRLRSKIADQIMSHGVQLPDLLTMLPPEESLREFQHELAAMRALCLKLLEGKKLVA
jgi:hypothetical protein